MSATVHRASALAQRFGHRLVQPVPSAVPLLVKDRRPGSKAAAYGTVLVGLHGLLLVLFLAVLWLRQRLRGGLSAGGSQDAERAAG